MIAELYNVDFEGKTYSVIDETETDDYLVIDEQKVFRVDLRRCQKHVSCGYVWVCSGGSEEHVLPSCQCARGCPHIEVVHIYGRSLTHTT